MRQSHPGADDDTLTWTQTDGAARYTNFYGGSGQDMVRIELTSAQMTDALLEDFAGNALNLTGELPPKITYTPDATQ